MIENIFSIDELHTLARRKRAPYLQKRIAPDQLDAMASDGWRPIGRRRKSSVVVRREKPQDALLEDRVWSCLFQMGFKHLSGDRGCKLPLDPKDGSGPTTQIDILAIDEEVAIAVECKSAVAPRKEPRFQEVLAKHGIIRERLGRALASQFPSSMKRRTVLALFTSNLLLNENDRTRAEEQRIMVFDENDLSYYEALVRQLGPAARFQFLCDLIPGGSVPGLELTVPAVKARMGGFECYTFCASPEYLLKISYVAHRAKGGGSDIHTYQRMVSKGRLASIRKYISDDGIFPTNLVLSVQDPALFRFDRGEQRAESSGATLGWLHLAPTYKSAWIIDGQHRLFAYSGHQKAASSLLPVLAFVGLPASEQAQLFIDINGEQRRVKPSLLEELFAELHWNSTDDNERIAAIVSKVVQLIDGDVDSPFYGRILRADEPRNDTRCISLASMFQALQSTGFYSLKSKKGKIIEYGPLWTGDNESTLRRTSTVLNSWFAHVRQSVPDQWEAGADESGGLAMNDGVTILINVLRSVLQFMRSQGSNLIDLRDKELVERLDPFGEALGDYLRNLTTEERREFRQLRGAQGQSRGSFWLQTGIRDRIAAFNPPGLSDYLERQTAQTTEQSQRMIGEIERSIHRRILVELRAEFGDGDRWWFDGVPKSVRQKVDDRINEDQGKRGGREDNFDLIDYRSIALQNWTLFKDLFSIGDSGNKDKLTSWLVRVNDIRRTAMHPSRSVGVSFGELEELQKIRDALMQKIGDTSTPVNVETATQSNAN